MWRERRDELKKPEVIKIMMISNINGNNVGLFFKPVSEYNLKGDSR